MAILMIFDGQKNPPAFRTVRYGETTQEMVRLADDLAKGQPGDLYEVYDNVGVLAYRR